MKINHGNLNAEGLKFAIIVGRFNEMFSKQLLNGALDKLQRHGASDDNIEVTWVPGSFEIPLLAQKVAPSVDAVICLGAVVRGDTPHFDYVAGEVAKGVAKTSLDTETPVIFGVITTDTIEQAIERSGTKAGNKGAEAAESAIETANVIRELS